MSKIDSLLDATGNSVVAAKAVREVLTMIGMPELETYYGNDEVMSAIVPMMLEKCHAEDGALERARTNPDLTEIDKKALGLMLLLCHYIHAGALVVMVDEICEALDLPSTAISSHLNGQALLSICHKAELASVEYFRKHIKEGENG